METGPDISEAVSYNGRICQADETTRQAEMVISDDEKQLQKGEKIEAVEEAGIEITEVEEINKKAIPGDKNHDTINVTGTSSQMAKTEEENLNIEGHETLKDERVHDQHVEVISNQQASIEEIPQSTEREMKDAQKEEERETVVDKDDLVESSEEVISILEATAVQTSKASVHTKDLTVNNLKKDVETVTDLCTKDETIDKSSTADTTLFQEGLEETKLKGLEYKETEKYSDLVAEEKGLETIRPSEEKGNKDKKDKVMYDRIEDASFSTKEESPNIQNDEGTTLDIGDGDKDKPEKSSVILEQSRTSQQEDGPEVGEKIKDACSTECEEKKQDATELNKQEKDVTSVEDEMQNKNRLDTPFVTEETSQQEVDNSEIFKVDPKIGLENIVVESTKEVTNPNEIFEKFAQADSSASENSKDVENYDKKPDASSGTCEDGMQSKAEDLDVTEASAGETREKEGFTVMVNEDNISKTDFIEAMKLSKLESKEHEGGPEHNLLQQNEPEKEELERPSNRISEEIEIGASRENTQFENPEDSFKEKRQDDKSTATYDTTSVEIPGQKNPPLIDSNEKTESSEAEIPNNNANNLHVTHSLVEETEQVQGKRIDEVFEFEPEEEIQKSTCTSTDEENQAANASEAYKSTEGTVIEHSSPEGTVRMETNITEKLETVYGLESDEKLEVSDAQANIPEVAHKEEAIVIGIHKIAKSNDIEEGSLENDRTKVAHSVYTGDKTVEQSLPVRSLTEPAPTLSGEDERSNIILEEVHDGHKIPVPGSGDVNKEQIFEANATFFTPKPNEKETTKIYQDSEKETKISREEDGSLEIMKEGQVNELSHESIGKGPIQDFKEDEKEAYKDEILAKSQPARAGESIVHEINHDESSEEILHASLAKQEEGLQGEVEHLVSTEASAENGDKDTSSVKVTEDNNDNNNIGLAEPTGNSAKVTPQGEEDSEEGLQIDETASIVVESPEDILIASLVKQKEDLQEEGEKLDSTEASIKNNDEETYSIKMAEENDENNKLAETTETSVKVTPKGEEDSEHALQHDEPRETKHEFESPGEVLDTSLVNPGKGLQGESTNLAQAETSQEKRDEGISSVKVVDNDRLAETTENREKATPEGEEDSDQILQKDEPGEGITRETNNGAEIPENISDPTLVTQEEGLQGESENLAPTEAAIEKRDEDKSYIKVTEDNDDNEQAEGTENSEKVTPEGGEDSEKILQIDEPRQSIVGMENRNVDSPEGEEDSEHALQHNEPRETNHEFESPGEVLDTSLVGKGLQGECTNLAPAETSQEKRDEGISSVKIVEDNDRLVETTEDSAKATPEGEEDSDQILQKDEPAEGITRETNNGAISDPTLVKQEEDLQGESENLAPRTEAAIEKREEESYIKVTEDNNDNEQAEVTENSEKVTPEGGEDSEKILQVDEPGQSILGMENHNVDSPEGEEDSEQALQRDEPRETNHEFESPGEILDTSLVNSGKGLQGESTNLAQAETSQEKRDEAIASVKVAVDNDDNDKLAEAIENSAKATPEGEENSEQILQKYEPGEGITHETNNGAEILETISDPPLVKQEEGLQGESENLAPTEAAIEKRDEDTSYIKEVEDNNDNGQAEAIENSEKVTPEGGEDSEKIQQINEPGQNIVGMENRNVDSPENNLDTLFVKQEEVLQGEGYNSVLTKTSIENSDEDTFSVKVAENNDENNRPAETMEDGVKVTPNGEENSEQVLQKDDPQEKYHNVESPDNILDKSLLNLEEDLHVDGEDLAPTEASIENKDEDSSLVKVAEHKDGNNRQDEARENNADGTPKGEEDSEHVLQKDAVDESIACETDHEVEKHEKALNTPLAKQEECLQGQDENMIPTEASIEKRDGEISSTKIAEGNDGINRVAEAEGNSVKETAKGGEELEPVFQRDANEKLEQLLDVTPEEMEAESSSENMKKSTCMKEEGIIQNLEETSEREKREETETTDDKKEKEAAREKTFDATTSIDKGNRELILEEIDSVKDQSPEFNEKETTEENSKDQQECRGLGTTASSIEEEKPNLEEPGIAELSSSSVGEVIVKELKEEVKGPNLEFIEQIGAKDLTEESKSGTLQDSEEPNKNFSTLIIAETSSFVPDIFEKMIKEQILKQDEHTNNDFDSASVTILSEETGLKEAKPEDNEQVKSSDIATEGPATTETDRSNLVNVDIDVQPEKITSLEENRNKGILTVAEGGREKKEHQMEDKAPTTGIGHEVEVATAEKPLDSISEDSFQGSYMTPLKDHEPMIIELSRIVEETLARDETTYANAKTPSRVKETNENLTQKEDESIKSKDVSELFSSDDGKEGVNEEVQKHKDAESHMLPKIHNEKNSYDAEDVDISKRGETSDSADQTEVFITSVSKGNREHILEETDIVKDQSPTFNEKETTEENSKDDQESRGFETTASHIETEQPNLEEPNIKELSSLSVGEVTRKENLKEDESDAMKLKEEVKSPDLEFIEQIRVKDLTEESKSGTLQDSAVPNKNIILTSAENSSFVPEVSEKETKEEILKQEERTNNDFDSASVTVLCEETGLKEAKPENYEQVKSSDIASEGKGPATIETEETNLDNVDIDVQPEEISGLEENRNKEISTVADGGEEKIEHQMEKEEPPGGIGHEVEVTTAEKPIDSISEDSSRDSYVMPLKDHEPITIVVSKTVEETPEKDVIADVNAKTPSSVQETDEKLIQKEDEPIKPKDVSELFSSDNGKEGANEKVQKLKDADSQMPPELHGEKNSYDTEDLEISQRGETSDLADQTEVSKLDTFTHENPSNEASKDIAISTCKDSEKATLEQEDSVQNLEGSLKGDVVEKGTAELNAGAHSHECEPTNTKDNDQIAEKNLESADLGQKPDFVSESMNKDQSDDTLPQTNKSQTEENKDDVQEWNSESVEQKNIGQIEGETERKMEMEPKLEAKDHIHESQKAEDTITAVSTTEKVHDGVKKVNGSEDIREHATDGDSDVKEIHTVSTRDEIAEKEKDSGPESTEYLKTIDSEEHTGTTNTKIEEDPAGETETPVTKAPEEEKIPDESGLEPADVHKGVEDVDESESTREQAIEGESNLKEIHTILAKDEILEKEKDYGLESTECLKASYSKEQTETVNTNIEEDPRGETKVLITEAPTEVKIPNEDGLEPAEEHEGVEKVNESENIIEQAKDIKSDLKETHAIFARDEILDEGKDCGPDSIEYVKTTDSKEQIETVKADIEKDSMGELEAPVTKAPEEEKIKDKSILKQTDEREGVDKIDESENIREEATDGDSGLKETHAMFARDETLEEVKDCGLDSIEYVKTTESKEQIETANTNIEKDPMGESKAPITKALEEEKIQDEGIPKPTDESEGVDKTDESENIREEATDGDSGLKETHAMFARDETLEEVKDCGLDSIEYVKTTESKEQIETANTNIEKDPMGESKAPITKALEEEKIQDEGIPKPTDESEGVDKTDESENIREEATDGDSGLKETHAIFARDEILEEVKDCGLDSIEHVKTTDSKEQIETVNANIEKDPMGESEAPVTKALEEQKIQDEGIHKPTDEREGVNKTDESENIREEATDGDSGLKETPSIFARDEILEEVKDFGPDSIEYVQTTDSKEQTKTVNADIEKDPMGKSEAPITKAPEEENIQDEDMLKPTNEHKGVDKTDERENIREEATDGDSGLKETHAIFPREEILEEEKDSGPEEEKIQDEGILKPTDEREGVDKTDESENIREEATDGDSGLKETHAIFARDEILEEKQEKDSGPEEEKIQDEGILKPTDEREGVDKTDESENIREEATDGDSGLKETHTIFARDEILEEKQEKDSGPDSIEYVKTTDSKEQIETVNVDNEKDPMGDSETPVTKSPEEEKIQDEGILKPTNEREGVDKTDESENIREEATDGQSGLMETHAIFARDEKLEEVKDCGPDSIEYVKTTDSKEQIETVNANIEKDPMGESEAPVTKVPEEEKIQDEGILKPTDESEGVDESENIKEEATDGDSGLKETRAIFARDETLEEVKDCGPDSIEYAKTTDSKEQIKTVNADFEKDPMEELEAPVTKVPEEEKIQDEGILKPIDEREGVDKTNERENIKEEATDGDSGLKETHAIFARDETLEEAKDCGPDSIEYVKTTDSKEQIEMVNTNIEKDPMGESEAPVTKVPEEEKIQDEGILKPIDERERVDKTNERENIKKEATGGDSGLKETHAIFARDETLEEVKACGPDSIEYVKTTDSKEQIEMVNTDIEKYPMGESEAPVTKAPEEEKIQDEGILKPTDESEGVDESENIKEEATDGDSGLKETRAIFARDEILEEKQVKDYGPDSIEYVKTTNSKAQIEMVNTDIEKDPMGESEAPFTKAPEEEKIQDESILKPIDQREGIDKTDESENIREEAADGDSGLKETDAIFARDKILEEKQVKDCGSDSIEYVKTTDSKEQIETVNTDIEKDPMGESKVPFTKAPEEEKIQDASIFKPTDEREGVDKIDESENIREEAIDGDSGLKETQAIFARDEILEEVKDCGPDSIEYVKTTNSKERIETVNADIENDPMGESEAPVTKAPKEEKIQDEVILKPTNESEGVDKTDESENINVEATDGDSGLKETHAIFARDEILEEVKYCGLDSIEHVKSIETMNANIEKDPMGESEAPVTKAPEEEKIQDEGILMSTNEREGVDKTNESENLREEATDGDSSLKEIHTVSVGQEIVENLEESGPKSIEYLKATDSKEQTKTANMNIEKVTTGEIEVLVTRTREEDSLKPVEVHEEVEKVNESKNIIEQAIDGESGLEEIHTRSVGDEILEKMNNSGPESTEYLKATDSKEQIGTANTNIEEYPTGETEAPFTKALEEEEMKDEGTLKPADVHEEVEKVDESDNIIQQATDGESDMKNIHSISIEDEKLENVKDSGSESIEYFKEIDSKEHIETENKGIKENPTRETEVPVIKAPKEENFPDEGSLKPVEVHEGVEKATESENIIEQPVDGVSNLKEIHTISIGDEILENINNSGPESTEYLKATGVKEQIGRAKTNIEEYPTGETEAPFTKAPEEEEMKDEGTLKPADVHEGVEKVDESDNIRQQATDGESGMKKIHTISIVDEKFENAKDSGSESMEYFKEIDSKEHIETENKGIKEDPTGETELPVIKAPKEENLPDEGSLKPVEANEGVEKTTESENIIEQPVDGVSNLKEIHTISIGDEILEKINNSGPKSIEYLKATDVKEQIGTANTNIEEYPKGETEAPFTKALEEEEMKDEGTLKPTDVREGVEKVDESDNIRQQAKDGENNMKKIHTISIGDEKLENVKDSGSESIEYFKEIDSKEHIETENKGIKEDPTGETEVPVTKATKEENIPDEGSLKLVEVHEGVEKATESENIIEQPVDGVSNLQEIHTISIGDEILEKVNDSGLESIEYLKETDYKEQIETLNTDIEKATLEETEALVIKAPEEQKIQDEGSLMTADVHEEVEQVAESENIIQQNKDGANEMEEIHTGSTRDEIFENVKESGPKSTEYLKETNSKEQTKAVNMDIGEDTTGEEGLVKITEVHEEVEKVNESKNIIEQVKNGESSLKEIRTRSTGDEILEKMNDSGPDSTEYPKATDFKEQIITVNKNIEDPTGETEAPVTKAPEEEEMQDEGILKPADVHEGFEKVDESVHIKQQAIEVESDLIKIHTISTGDKILENVKDSGSESNEYIKATDSMEHTETKNMDIKEDPTWEAEVPFIKKPKEENIPDEGSLNPTEAHEGVEKVHGSENNIEQPVDGVSDLKEIYTKKSIGDEILEKVKNFGPESIEYLEETDSKEHIEPLNTNFEKDSSSEPEALVTKVPAVEKIQDEVSLNTADAHEGVEQVDESENNIQQNPDGEHYSQEIHTGSTEDEILKNVENSGPKSIDIKEDTREIEASLTKEEKIQDEGSLNPTDGHEGVEKVDRSENIREYAIVGESNLKEIHTTFVGDEILEKVKDSDQKSTKYHRATDSKEQIETVNTDIEEDPIQEMEAPITKAPEVEKIQDEDSLKPANVHEGVEKANGSENIKEQAIDGESALKEIYTISVGDGILEKDKDFGPESIKYLKETKSEQEIATVNTNIEEDPIGETEATVTKAQEEEKIQDEGGLKAVDGHEGVEKADGSANNREQVIDGESDFKEIHEVSLGDDTLNKVKYCSPESTVYLKATDSEEHIETVNTTINEDPIEETEVPATRALEEEEEEKIQDEGCVKPTNVSVTVAEDEEEKIKEDIKVEEDNFPDNADNAIVIPADSSLGEAQMVDKPVKDTSSDESLKTINAEPCPHAEEVGSMTPEKTSFSLVSQLPNMKHNDIETETVTPEKPDADEETKTVSDAVFQSKYHGVEETNETGQSLRVENLDADRTEGIKEASGTVLESKSLGTEAVTIDEITADQNLPAGKLEEQLQTPSSELLSWEQEHGPTTIVKETEAIKTKEGEILDDKNISDSSATKATEETCLQKEEQPETLSSIFLSTEQEHRTTTTFKKTEEENIKEVEMLDEKGINNSSAIKATEEACLEQEEPKELAVSKLGLLDGASKLETADKEECEKIKELTSPIEDASNLSFETSEKALETMLDVHSREALINSEEEIQDEGIVKSEGVSITVAKDSFEYIKEEIKVDNICDKTENATAEVVTAKPSSVEAQLNDKSTEDTISDDRVETSTRESNPPAEEVASMKLEKTSSNLPSQLLNVATKNEEKESETLENPDANEVEETKTASDAFFESKYEGVKETGETGEILKVEKLDAADIEEMKEISEISSKSKALGLVEVSEDEVIADQTLPAGNLGEQLQPSSSFLSREEQHGTTVTVKRTEEENMKEVKTPSGEVRKEEGSTLDQASKVEPHVKEEIKYADSPSETDEIIKLTRPIPSNLNFGITEKAFTYVSEVQSHEVLTKSEDINEKHLQTAIPDLNTEESESQCKKTVEANKILKNEVSIEEVTEEQEFAKDAKSVSLGEETIIESHQGYESKSEEYPAEETNKTCKATTDAHQHEALRLSEIIDEGNLSEDIAKTIQVEDRTVENENAAESYLDKVQGETVKEAAMKLDLENKSGDTNFTKATTEVMTLEEKEAGIEILQKEGKLGIAEVKEITQNIQQLETTSYAASETKIPGEECPSENTGTIITTAHEDVQPVLQHPIDKALEKVELKVTRPGKSTEADAEVREVECEGEKRIGDLGEILTEKSTSEDSAKISLSDLMHRSKKENLQVTKDLTKEREPVPSKEEMQNQEAETTVDETKTDEEEGDEHKRTDPGYDAPVMVEAAKDIDVKVVHKKHNILSGVGSKVKHSLYKVKKAITGKSSHPKTTSPK
ncbi:titin homolog isoform X26 [Quercus lobata]|uniref:titin homolog isoform X26 n=1 Tax=Quercus lobata TaxID=97700 RepID=UPI0012466CA0|nr:titin homolog isoform X26 [Quercus lobata]